MSISFFITENPAITRRRNERLGTYRQMGETLRRAARLADEAYNLSSARAERARIAQLHDRINQHLREALAKIEKGEVPQCKSTSSIRN